MVYEMMNSSKNVKLILYLVEQVKINLFNEIIFV